jgi:signal transduction histidine kinase
MRNPLSAILQCADEITTSLIEHKQNPYDSPEELLDSCIDAGQTITLCAQHQKRIVDDILTLSKLDSALLLVTPVDVQPVAVAQRALKMFEGELESNEISTTFQVNEDLSRLRIIDADAYRYSTALKILLLTGSSLIRLVFFKC